MQADEANALTGGEILTKLDTKAQYHYVSGVLAGLGYAQFLKEKPSTQGLNCFSNWLIEGKVERWETAKQWLEHHKEKPAGVIIYAMAAKDCGK